MARKIENGISLFETPSMKLTGKPIPAKGIVAFEFSPSDNLLAYWAPEEASFTLVSILAPLTLWPTIG